MREALAKKPPLEVRRRIERILARLEAPAVPPAEVLRQLRAAAALEWAGTPASRRHLKTLAGGAPAARLTREAGSALDRLSRRPVR